MLCVRLGCVCPPELWSVQVVEMRKQFGRKYAWILIVCLVSVGAVRASVAVAETQETIADLEEVVTGTEQAADAVQETIAGPPVAPAAGPETVTPGEEADETQGIFAAPEEFPEESRETFAASGPNSGTTELPMMQITENGLVEIQPSRIVFVGDTASGLSDEQKAPVIAYLERYYEAMGGLEMRDFSDLFAASANGQRVFNEKAIEYEIGVRTMQESDLHINSYCCELTILNVSVNTDGSVATTIRERSICRYAQSPDIDSEFPKLDHNFTLAQQNGRWQIVKHMQWDGCFWTMLKEYDGKDLNQMKNVETVFENKKNTLLNQRRSSLPARTEGAASQTPAVGHPYDREAAVAYARQYIGVRNAAWADYSDGGGNCQNFASQCIFAGGIPMDTSGDQKWKWYSDGVNGTSSAWGCSLSWINVDYFFAYARDNRGYGMSAEIAADFWSGQPGDAIVMGTPQDWDHTVLISEVIKDKNGRTIDYLLCSNTLDVKDFPLSAYPQVGGRLIRIFGWND